MHAVAIETARGGLENARPALPEERPGLGSWMMVIGVCLMVWTLARVIFFVGIFGSDDM